jgi:hypothetical protein
MSFSSPITVPALRQPEYTGENRCIPCTILNAAITIIAAAIVFYLSLSESVLFGVTTGGIVLTFGAVLIYFRGYLIPGTPQITSRFFPNWVLRWFDKAEPPDDIEPESVLRQLGAIEECKEGDDLCLTTGFEERWWNTMESLRESDTTHEDLATLLDIDMDEIVVNTHDDAVTARVNGQKIGQWESRAVLLADIAAAKEFASNGNSLWESLRTDQQGTVLNGLRVFLGQCPSCGGNIDFESDTVRSCCQYMDVVAASFVDCDARIFEVETPKYN